MGKLPTIAVSHLGCEKNRIDTEHMLGLLVQAGYEVDANEELADYVIVNTCSFIQAAREESVRTLVELAEADKKIVITGCMAQHFREQLLEELPEAVALVGTGDYYKIVDVIARTQQGERVTEVTENPPILPMSMCPATAPPPPALPTCEWLKAATTNAPSASFPRSEANSDRDRLSRSYQRSNDWPRREFRKSF